MKIKQGPPGRPLTEIMFAGNPISLLSISETAEMSGVLRLSFDRQARCIDGASVRVSAGERFISQQDVQDLLPFLQSFAETGRLLRPGAEPNNAATAPTSPEES